MTRENRTNAILAGVFLAALPTLSMATEPPKHVLPLQQNGVGAYYTEVVIGRGLIANLLVDTGSSYVVLTPATFRSLKKTTEVRRLRKIRATMAGGRTTSAQVYQIPELTLAPACVLHQVEVVVLPGATRDILGLSALRRLGQFQMSFDPPELALSCHTPHRTLAQR